MNTQADVISDYQRETDRNWDKFLEVATDPELQGCKVKPSGRIRTMMSALATGWLPWGIQVEPFMPLCRNQFILCCGHALTPARAGQLAAAGLVEPGEDKHGRKAVQITEVGRRWLADNWIS